MSDHKSHQRPFFNIPKFFEEAFGKDFKDWTSDAWYNFGIYIPAANIKETPNSFELELTAPGRDKEDFTLRFEDDRLHISVPKKTIAPEEEERYTRKEFAYPAFRRQFNFPKFAVDHNAIKATYENGILKVTLPKREEAKTADSYNITVD